MGHPDLVAIVSMMMERRKKETNGHVTDNPLEQLVHVGRRTLRLLDDRDDSLTILSVVGSLNLGAVEVSNLLRATLQSMTILIREETNELEDRSRYRAPEHRT